MSVRATNVTRITAAHNATRQLGRRPNNQTNHARSPRAFNFRQIASSGKDIDLRALPSLPEAKKTGDESGERCLFFLCGVLYPVGDTVGLLCGSFL